MVAVRPIPFRAGVVKDERDLAAGLYARSSDKIRFVGGYPQSIGGWVSRASGLVGAARDAHEWVNEDGTAWLAIGTTVGLFAYSEVIGLIDITPIRTSGDFDTSPFTTTSGSTLVSVSLPSHGARINDRVIIRGGSNIVGSVISPVSFGGITLGGAQGALSTGALTATAGSRVVNVSLPAHLAVTGDIIMFSGASAVGGVSAGEINRSSGFRIRAVNANLLQIELDAPAASSETGGGGPNYRIAKTYLVRSITDLNTFVIDSGQVASGSVTGGGTGATYQLTLNAGRKSTAVTSGGYGTGVYGAGLYGVSDVVIKAFGEAPAQSWTIDNRGFDLVANVIDGPIYEWTINFSSRASVIPNAPTRVRAIKVTPERVLLAMGTITTAGNFDPMHVRFPDGTNIEDWTPAATNNAGSFDLSEGSRIMTAVTSQSGVVVHTDTSLYGLRFVGQADQIYRPDIIGTNCGLIAAHAAAEIEGDIYWISPQHQFYEYRGGRPRMLSSPLQQWFERRLENAQRAKIFAAADTHFPAIMWHFPTEALGEPIEYLRIDLAEARRDPRSGWSHGTMGRSAMTSGGVFPSGNPFGIGDDGKIYEHEVGYAADGADMRRLIEYAPIFGENAAETIYVSRTIVGGDYSEDIVLTMRSKASVKGSEASRESTIVAGRDRSDRRARGRFLSFGFECLGQKFMRLGVIQADIAESFFR